MVNDDGTEARLVTDPPTGRCPLDGRPWDEHHYIRDRAGKASDVAMCPLAREKFTFGPLRDDEKAK